MVSFRQFTVEHDLLIARTKVVAILSKHLGIQVFDLFAFDQVRRFGIRQHQKSRRSARSFETVLLAPTDANLRI
jgi:hypothetical protein